jgi:hypothetical protein
MRITNVLLGLLFLTSIALLAGCSGMDTAEREGKQELSFAQVDRHDVLYTCSCGPQCNCNTVSIESGKCDCGRILKWGHILKIEGTNAILCQRAEGCQCYGLNLQDPAKCTCGVPTERVSLVGTGICFCNGGASSYCNYVSDSSGKCRCGNKLTKAG